ncbi:MAG TPA: hypothetical protein VFQ76_19005, partial [Longimicrobiaceae bacterium]|nr:hypothetical protein [Longimicrobiaceae bacterium]
GVLWLAQRGLLPGVRPLWWGLLGCSAGTVGMGAALAEGPWRAAAASAGAVLALAGLAWLWRPLVHLDEGLDRFPDV